MIIGLSGYAQTGKDTIADYLIKNYGFTRVSFADPIREALYKLNPNIRLAESYGASLSHAVDSMGWEEVKRLSADARELLQRLGTEVGRSMFGDSFWVDMAMEKARSHDKVVFTDVRYPNELQAIVEASGAVWRVVKDNVGAVNRHASETALDDYQFEYIIFNNDTIESLYESIDNFMN
jgi:signal transduction histidine kinase